jgi:hypothetical protein
MRLAPEDAEKIVLSKFNEDDPWQHMMKVMFGCGIYAAFRGSTEHVLFSPLHISIGTYPHNFESKHLAGLQYVAIDTFQADKSNKITVNINYARDTSQVLRFPIIHDDPNDFGAAVYRLYKKMSPGQIRMYCYPVTDKMKANKRIKLGEKDIFFYGKRPLGVNKIRSLLQDGARLLGLPLSFKPHSLRALCITRLANDSSVSLAETMSVARHSSVSASKEYQALDGHSEHNRLRALGVPVEKLPVTSSKLPPEDTKPPQGTLLEDDKKQQGLNKKRKNSDVDYGFGDSESESSTIEIGAHRVTSSSNDVSMTQVGIENLKEDIGDLKEMLVTKPPPKPRMSENQRQILELSNVVQGLKKELNERNHDRLYYESLVADHVREIDELKYELRTYKIAEEEEYESTRGAYREEEVRRTRGAFRTCRPGEYTKNRRRVEEKRGWR